MTNDKLQIEKQKLLKGFIAQAGFTIIELMVSIGILIVLFTMTTINLSPLPSNTLQSTNLDTLLSDIRAQQTLAMSDDSSYGVHFESGSYTLFIGSSYVAGAASNFVVTLDSGIIFSNVTWPSLVIVFSSGTGDITGYSSTTDSFTIASTVTNKSSTIKINKYGATYE